MLTKLGNMAMKFILIDKELIKERVPFRYGRSKGETRKPGEGE